MVPWAGEQVCYGQIEDAGPARYDDAAYVFGSGDPRRANTRFNNAGLDVTVDRQFVNAADVPP